MNLLEQFQPPPPAKGASLGQWLVYRRKCLRLSAHEVGILAGVSHATVYLAEDDKASYETQITLGKLLEVPAKVLEAAADAEIERLTKRVRAKLGNAA